MKFKNLLYLVFLITISIPLTAQKNRPVAISNQSIDFTEFSNKSFVLKPNAKINLSFELKNESNKEEIKYLKINNLERIILFEIIENAPRPIGMAGSRIKFKERSVLSDHTVIKLRLKAHEFKSLVMEFENLSDEKRIFDLQLLDLADYQQLSEKKENSFYEKHWKLFFFGVLILAICLTVFQYLVLPEKSLIYYFLYIFFTAIRSSAASETFVLELYLPWLNHLGYHSLYSQVFTYAAFIFYTLFVREFTGFPSKKPHLDWAFKFQIGFLVFFIVFDLVFPIQKYDNPTLLQIFRALETIGMAISIYTFVLITRVYDSLNKYVIQGAFALIIIAMLGQEILKRSFHESQDQELQKMLLAILWSVAYLVEILFFSMALIKRQRMLLKAIETERNISNEVQNENLSYQQAEKILPDLGFKLSTNRGVLVFKQADIIRLEASGNYTIFYFHNQKPTLGSYTLSDFESRLNPAYFLRVHKSHLVNLDYVTKYTKGDGGVLTLHDGTEIPVSRSRKEEVFKRLNL